MKKRDRIFCEEYMIDLCAKSAALRAGFAPSTAADAWKWIKEDDPAKPEVKAYIDKLMAERSKRVGISADRVLREIGRIAFANITDAVDPETGKVKKGASPDDTAAIAAIKVRKGRRAEAEVRMCDKNSALMMLAKHLGMTNPEKESEDGGMLDEIIEAVGEIE